MISPFFLGLIALMGYELSRDVLRASQLVEELKITESGLRESEARINLAIEAGDFGIWIRDLERDNIWASEILGLPVSGRSFGGLQLHTNRRSSPGVGMLLLTSQR